MPAPSRGSFPCACPKRSHRTGSYNVVTCDASLRSSCLSAQMADRGWMRQPADVERLLRSWLTRKLGDGVELTMLGGPSGAGNSSDTMLFDANGESFVLRLPPSATSFPLFPHYDLARQVAAMNLVRTRSSDHVPRVVWFEAEETDFGAPFVVMERIDGEPVPDAPPYVFGSWLTDAT